MVLTTDNIIIEYTIYKHLCNDINFAFLPVDKISFRESKNEETILEFKLRENINMETLAFEELIYLKKRVNESGEIFNIETLNREIAPFGYKITVTDKCKKFLESFLIENSWEEENNLQELQEIIRDIINYQFFILFNLTTKEFITNSNSQFILKVKAGVLNKEELQKFIDDITLEFIEFPFLISMISEIRITSNFVGSFEICRNIDLLNTDNKVVVLTDSLSPEISYTLINKVISLYKSNMAKIKILELDNEKFNKGLSSDTIKLAMFIGSNIDSYTKAFGIINVDGRDMPQLRTKLPSAVNIYDSKVLIVEKIEKDKINLKNGNIKWGEDDTDSYYPENSEYILLADKKYVKEITPYKMLISGVKYSPIKERLKNLIALYKDNIQKIESARPPEILKYGMKTNLDETTLQKIIRADDGGDM